MTPISKLPKVRAGFAAVPTPVQELKNLSKVLGPRIFVKRDDLTSLGFGGNKVRKLDFLVPDLQAKNYDTIVTTAGFQSNWCTAVSAAARKSGMKAVLVKRAPAGYAPTDYEGNHLLHMLLGAEIHTAEPKNIPAVMDRVVAQLRKDGRRPVHIGVGGNTPYGVMGYIDAMRELASQAKDLGVTANYVVHASGSGGTQAGTVIGASLYSPSTTVVCSSTGSRTTQQGTALVLQLIKETVGHFNLDLEISESQVTIHDQYAGGYGHASPAKLEAVKLLADTEGLLLDPVYTASGMACLIDQCRRGTFKRSDTVVFINTGGQAALFPYEEALKAYYQQKPLPWTVPSWEPQS